jgi:hypothetical protein
VKQLSVERFSGLQIQPNSFTTAPGSFERADNVVVSQDFLITKARGVFTRFEGPSGQLFNRLFDYDGFVFGISQNAVYRFVQTAVVAQSRCVAGSPVITVRRVSHGLRNGDFISEVAVVNSDPFVAAFPNRHVDFAGIRGVTSSFSSVAATRLSNVLTITLANHGLQTGDRIEILASTLSVALSVQAVTVTGTNTFTIPSTGSNGSGTVTFCSLDAFRITASQNALSSVTSGASAFSYIYYAVLSGPTVSVTGSGVGVSRVVKSNKNAYFTTDNGVYKLERSDLPVLKSGAPPGLDLSVTLGRSDGGTGLLLGPVKPQYNLAYRILFGRKDANGNLVLGAPSEFYLVKNATLYSVGNANLSFNLGTQELTITRAGNGHVAGEFISLYGCTGFTPAIPDGTRVLVTSPVSPAGSFVVDLSPLSISAVTTLSIQYGDELTPQVTFTVPDGVDSTQWLYRVYRTAQTQGVSSIPDPNTYTLVQEENLTSFQIANNYVDFYDSLDDALIAGNPTLYTNPNNEGELQANARPPLCRDAAVFKGYTFYANTSQYRSVEVSVVAPDRIADADIVDVGLQTYLFRGDSANAPVGNARVTSNAITSSYVEITQPDHGFQNGDTVVVVGSVAITGLSPGPYAVSSVTTTTFRVGSGASGGGTVTYEGLSDALGKRLVKRVIPSSTVTLSEAIDQTARYWGKAINRNPDSTVYASYISGLTGAPGKLFLSAKDLNAPAYSLTTNTTVTGEAFLPTLPTSGTAVSGLQETFANELLVSKLGEPEAVPAVNSFKVGSQSAAILRIAALRDSLIVLKEDGVFRLNGDSLNNFSITALDTTVLCKATDSVDVLNNSVYAFTNQGVVQIADTSVRILSRPIEPFLSAILGDPNLESVTGGLAYESERLYLLSTKRPGSASADVVYCYNYLNDAWTTFSGSPMVFVNGFVSSLDDKMMLIPTHNPSLVVKERKDNTKVDYSRESVAVLTLNALASNAQSLVGVPDLTISSSLPHGLSVGDVVTLTRCSSVLAAVYPGGASDVNGLRVVTGVVDDTTFIVDAASNALLSLASTVFAKKGICESDLSCAVVAGDRTVVITTSVPHGLSSGSSVTINGLSSAVSAALSNPSDLTGFRSLTVLSSVTFSVRCTNAPIGSATGTVNVTDKRQNLTQCTLDVPANVVPQPGDAVVLGTGLFKIERVIKFSNVFYLVEFIFPYMGLSTDPSFLHSGYTSTVKWNPITGGNTGQLKYFPEFQTSFRTQSSCTGVTLNFSNDSFPGTTATFWNFKVGSDKRPITFGGWGQLVWGAFPWGGEVSIDKEFVTSSAVILRVYTPKDAFVGTYLQPSLDHRIAGEPLEIQSISFLMRPVSERTTK